MAEKHSWLKDKYRAIFGYTGESRDTCKIVQHPPLTPTLTGFQKSLLVG